MSDEWDELVLVERVARAIAKTNGKLEFWPAYEPDALAAIKEIERYMNKSIELYRTSVD